MIEAGARVEVSEPVQNYDGSLLLPGETIFVVERRRPSTLASGDRSRVRCPASGADMWVDTEVLREPQPRGLLGWLQ